jgi:hypothetical protein
MNKLFLIAIVSLFLVSSVYAITYSGYINYYLGMPTSIEQLEARLDMLNNIYQNDLQLLAKEVEYQKGMNLIFGGN